MTLLRTPASPVLSASAEPALDPAVLDHLDEQVRARVRRDDVDPQRDPAAVRRIAHDVVRAHDEHSLTGAVAPVPDVDGVVAHLLARVSGFGPLQPLLDDPTVEEIWINDPSLVR